MASSIRRDTTPFGYYLIGIGFAAILLVATGTEWLRNPTFMPAVLTGIITIIAPFFVMQPGMGAGIAWSKSPNPTVARLRSLVAHTIFGVGLYLGGLVANALLGS
jgi:hypothetical protein